MIRAHARRGTAPGLIHNPTPIASPAPNPRPSLGIMRPTHPRNLAATLLGATLLGAGVLTTNSCSTTPPHAPTTSTPTHIPIPTAAPTSASTTSIAPYDVLANLPPDAKEHTVKGAEAFARYFFEASSKVVENPSPGQFSRLCAPGALPCQWREQTVSQMAKEGWRPSGPELTVGGTSIIPDTPLKERYAYVTVLIQQHATTRTGPTGSGPTRYTAEKTYGVDVKLEWTSEGWRVHEAGNPEKTGLAR